MRELCAQEINWVSGGGEGVRVNVDLNRDGKFDTTGILKDGKLTLANGVQMTEYEWLPNPDYLWGQFWANNDTGWRDSDAQALAYDLYMAQNQESTAELGQDVITFTEVLTDAFDPRTWLDMILGDAAEDAEAEQDRLQDLIDRQGDVPATAPEAP